MSAGSQPARLSRRLGVFDAVVVGLGSMLGAGVFAAVGPAAQSAGGALVYSLLLAAVVAYLNATSSAQLAAIYPASGATYVYGRERLGRFWGYLAGWGFVVGKVASCAAIALTFGAYMHPPLARPLAVAAVVVVTAVNYRGIGKTASATRLLVGLVGASLLAITAGALVSEDLRVGELAADLARPSLPGVLQGAGLLFFAFAGYARIATLGEEVRDPKRTIPRAIPLALSITLVVYLVVETSALLALGPDGVASSPAPLTSAVSSGRLHWLAPAARLGAAIASLGVLLSLVAGVSRTLFAMAGNREMPPALAAVHQRFRIPHRAQVLVGGIVAILAAATDLRSAIGFSSFSVLGYYAITNASALTLARTERRWPRAFSAAGVIGCLLLAFTLPRSSVISGAAVLAGGALIYLIALRKPPCGPYGRKRCSG